MQYAAKTVAASLPAYRSRLCLKYSVCTKRLKYTERKLRNHCKTCLLDSVRNTLYESAGYIYEVKNTYRPFCGHC